MSDLDKEELERKMYKLEREKMEYLEVNDKRNANRKSKEIEKIQTQIELLETRKMTKEIKLLKKFIYLKGLNYEYKNFVDRFEKEMLESE